MKRTIIGTMLLAANVSAASAGDIDLGYENFYRDEKLGRARIIVKLTNKTGSAVGSAFVECAFLNAKQKAVDTAVLIGTNIKPGAAAYVDGWSSQRSDIEHVLCRVTRFR